MVKSTWRLNPPGTPSLAQSSILRSRVLSCEASPAYGRLIFKESSDPWHPVNVARQWLQLTDLCTHVCHGSLFFLWNHIAFLPFQVLLTDKVWERLINRFYKENSILLKCHNLNFTESLFKNPWIKCLDDFIVTFQQKSHSRAMKWYDNASSLLTRLIGDLLKQTLCKWICKTWGHYNLDVLKMCPL